ncbi:MAG: carboxy terminal-processing peptidase [Flavobacteriaceae bacterium]|nr:carboxy terminal-processing peptidase [Flavobacteriaceae bacterium]
MKRNYYLLMLTILLAFASCSFTSKTFDDPDKDKMLIQIITYILDRGHYDPKDLNDEFSIEVYSDYIENLDPFKRYFYQSDLEEFAAYEMQIDDQLKDYDLTFFNLTYQRLAQRMEESEEIYRDILESSFDYSKSEEFNSDYENIPYVKNKRQLKDRWRLQLKYASIANYNDLFEDQNNELEKDPDYETKTNEEIEVEAREQTLNSLNEYYDLIDDLERKDWFAVYINAIVEEFDPHTTYFAPEDKDVFDMRISGSFEGIGARLQKRMDEVKVNEIISGGPAWKGKELEVGDIILKVKQENEEQALSIVGMRLDNAIKFIKGPKGTKVTLTVKKVDGTIKEIDIVRDVVELEETYAKSSLVNKEDKIFGVINLPKFYADFDDFKNNRNATSDLKLEIERLKEQGMEGLVIDLRNNLGGSLQTAVDIVGLFIKDGPVVQVKSPGEPKEVLKDKDKSIAWDGPLVLLVNELSASASEILAAAMQDYKRAIVIGSKQTHGKGSVQRFVDLNRMVRNNKSGDLGALKLTVQKYYRINGGSVQLEGVKSDIVLPDRYSYIDFGEREYENPLPYDMIDEVDYNLWDSYFDYDTTIQKSKERLINNPQLKLIEESAKWVKTIRDEKVHPLNYEIYKQRLELAEKEADRFDKISEYKTNLSFESLPYEKELFVSDTILKEKRERWLESLTQDVYMEEAINVLNDLKISYEIKKVATIKD